MTTNVILMTPNVNFKSLPIYQVYLDSAMMHPNNVFPYYLYVIKLWNSKTEINWVKSAKNPEILGDDHS